MTLFCSETCWDSFYLKWHLVNVSMYRKTKSATCRITFCIIVSTYQWPITFCSKYVIDAFSANRCIYIDTFTANSYLYITAKKVRCDGGLGHKLSQEFPLKANFIPDKSWNFKFWGLGQRFINFHPTSNRWASLMSEFR